MGILPDAIPFEPYIDPDEPDPTIGIECVGDGDDTEDWDLDGGPVRLGAFANLPDRERRERLSRGEAAFRRFVDADASERAFIEIVAATGHAVLTAIFSQGLSSRVAAALRQVRDDI